MRIMFVSLTVSVIGPFAALAHASSFVTNNAAAVAAWQADCDVLGFDTLTGTRSFAPGTIVPPASQVGTQPLTCAFAHVSSTAGPAAVVDLKGTSQQGDARSLPNVIGGTMLSGSNVVISYIEPIHVALMDGAGKPVTVAKLGAWNDPTGSIVRLDVFDLAGVLLESTQGVQGQFIGIEREGIASASFTVVQFQSVVGFSLDDVTIGRGAVLADLDGSGVVGASDLAILLGAWGECQASCCVADLNADGVVDAADLAVLLGAWS